MATVYGRCIEHLTTALARLIACDSKDIPRRREDALATLEALRQATVVYRIEEEAAGDPRST